MRIFPPTEKDKGVETVIFPVWARGGTVLLLKLGLVGCRQVIELVLSLHSGYVDLMYFNIIAFLELKIPASVRNIAADTGIRQADYQDMTSAWVRRDIDNLASPS